MDAHIDPTTGLVTLSATVEGQLWRRCVMPHDVADLDAFAPDLPPDQRTAILADWAARPVPQGEE